MLDIYHSAMQAVISVSSVLLFVVMLHYLHVWLSLFISMQTASLLFGILIHSGWLGLSNNSSTINCMDTSSIILSYLRGGRSLGKNDICHHAYLQSVTPIGGLLLRHVLQLVCNAHAIAGMMVTEVSREHFVESHCEVRIAAAIYPTVSLMNHSCDPTVISR